MGHAVVSRVQPCGGSSRATHIWVGLPTLLHFLHDLELLSSVTMSSFLRVLSISILFILLSFYSAARFIFSGNSDPADPSKYYRGSLPDFLSSPDGKRDPVQLPLRTEGRNIVDARGTRVKLFSVNWYGASDEGMIPGGLEMQHRDVIAKTIRRLGFNSVRMPYSDEMVLTNPIVTGALIAANPDLQGLTALDIFAAVVRSLTDIGLFVVINNHITQARWCCDANVCDGLWKNDHWGPICRIRQTEKSWIKNLETIMLPHVNDEYVIGADLRNEVRGITDKLLWNSWAAAAEKAAAHLHGLQPEWLMFVEGISSANDISGARLRPVKLTVSNKLVYSAHVYGWSGWGSLTPFWRRAYGSFAAEMEFNWGFLLSQDIAPVWIGELGAPRHPSKGDLNYWDNMITFLREKDVDFAYWAINPRKWANNEREGYSIVRDDWVTPILDYRLFDMISLMQS